ncbi:MAG: hypothetical protein HC767_13550 [Akkermansiaceae bacterium]|nr:hypothetical protein [Akkermansiaceae bacterium]
MHSDIADFTVDQGGGEGVAALLEARDKAEDSFGYDWIHTVLVTDGRSFPWFPVFIVMAWTVLVVIILMLWCRFDRLLLEDYGYNGRQVEGICHWQRVFFLYMRGLEVRSQQDCLLNCCVVRPSRGVECVKLHVDIVPVGNIYWTVQEASTLDGFEFSFGTEIRLQVDKHAVDCRFPAG